MAKRIRSSNQIGCAQTRWSSAAIFRLETDKRLKTAALPVTLGGSRQVADFRKPLLMGRQALGQLIQTQLHRLIGRTTKGDARQHLYRLQQHRIR